ncbi:hypothetical protein ACP4OV_029784 [Aristida adscensionis]
MPSLLPLLLLLLSLAAAASGTGASQAPGEGEELVPVAPAAGVGAMVLGLNETRRRLGSFQLCAPCNCCGGDSGGCVPYPCCYAINCNVPNRPFGYCSFTPKACGCLHCNI